MMIKTFTKTLYGIVVAYLAERNTFRELNRLSDRELNDIGISRWDIPNIAKQEADMRFAEFSSYKASAMINGARHA